MHGKIVSATLSATTLEVVIEGQSSTTQVMTESLPARLALSGFNGTIFELLPPIATSTRHQHTLAATDEVRRTRAICDICRSTDDSVYFCRPCDWDICGRCLDSEQSAAAGTHSGRMVCQCSHGSGSEAFPIVSSRVHLNGTCKWDCCGANWKETACTAALTSPGGTNVAASSPGLTSDGRIPVGATVTVTPGYASCGDASDGPLSPGDKGVLVKDDRDHKPYKVRATSGSKAGSEWWYQEDAICLADNSANGVDSAAVSAGTVKISLFVIQSGHA